MTASRQACLPSAQAIPQTPVSALSGRRLRVAVLTPMPWCNERGGAGFPGAGVGRGAPRPGTVCPHSRQLPRCGLLTPLRFPGVASQEAGQKRKGRSPNSGNARPSPGKARDLPPPGMFCQQRGRRGRPAATDSSLGRLSRGPGAARVQPGEGMACAQVRGTPRISGGPSLSLKITVSKRAQCLASPHPGHSADCVHSPGVAGTSAV